MSLFNPWVLLALISAFLGVGAVAYTKGEDSEREKQQLEIAALNATARQKEQALVAAVNTQTTQLIKANNNAKLQTQKLHSALDAGSLKLRIPVKASNCAVYTTPDTEPSGRPDTGTAEIHPETAKAILDIGDEADTTVRKLNACLAIYNQVREMINEKK
jgi:hypothetical protein